MNQISQCLSDAPDLSTWLAWPTAQVARWIAAQPQPLVMGWPFNGTRRWYLAYCRCHPGAPDYLATLIRRQAELHAVAFAHGVTVLVSPGFGAELLERGAAYTRYVLGGLLRLGDDAVYQELFAGGVRLRFYGDYAEALDTPDFRPLLAACETLMAATAANSGPCLLIGLFADAPYATVARLSVAFAARWGRPPNRQELIEAYYGLSVPDLGLYIGFAQAALFDVPLLTTGREDLYATLNPSPAVTERQLRAILYDHLVTRRVSEVDYERLMPAAQEALVAYLERCAGHTLGIGYIDPCTGVWMPLLPCVDGEGTARL